MNPGIVIVHYEIHNYMQNPNQQNDLSQQKEECKKLRKRRKTTEEKISLLPRQALDEAGAEMIEGNSNFHVLVYCVLRVRAK